MRSYRTSETTSISLTKKDKILLESGKCLSDVFNFDLNYGLDSRTKLVLRLRSVADSDPDQLKFPFYESKRKVYSLSEPGIWYETFPPIPLGNEPNFLSTQDCLRLGIPDFEIPPARQEIKKLIITIDYRAWKKIINEGCFLTRWLFDRFQITYWEKNKEFFY
jgi:hypothetical protein